MHVLQLIWIYWALLEVEGQDNNEFCLESHGAWSDKYIDGTEYAPLEITFVRFVKSKCKVGALTKIWTKNGIAIKRETDKKARKVARFNLRFYSLSMTDEGNYTVIVFNEVFNFTYNVVLSVTHGSEQLRAIREHAVPSNLKHLVNGTLYWMPKMTEKRDLNTVSPYEDYLLECMYFSTVPLHNISTTWYRKRYSIISDKYGDIIRNNSRVVITSREMSCKYDMWLPTYNGYCYSAELHFRPFIPNHSGSYTCVVNNNLNVSVILFDEVSSFHPIRQQDTITNKTNLNLTDTKSKTLPSFNENTNICVGSKHVFLCSSAARDNNLSLWFYNGSGDEFQLGSSNGSSLSYHIKISGLNDSGKYICKESSSNQNHMTLNVVNCSLQTLLRNVIIGFIAIISLLLIMTLSLLSIMVYRRCCCNAMIHSTSQLKVDGMHCNERYIPLLPDFQWEILHEALIVSSEELGTGQYGKVYRGRLGGTDVAVKVARTDGHCMLLKEIEVMKQLGYHRNVIQLMGVCSMTGPLMVVLELARNGNLKQYLQTHNPVSNPFCEQLGLERLLSFVTQIANGMQYLASKRVIHRDLAARNCLLASDMTIKLSDFGLTRVALIYHLQNSQDLGAVAWMAPEAVVANIFTNKSDIWSFGIVMWEVFALGAIPYPLLSLPKTIEAISQGVVNSQPVLASDAIYAIMTSCWAMDPSSRPTFAELKVHLNEVDVNEYL